MSYYANHYWQCIKKVSKIKFTLQYIYESLIICSSFRSAKHKWFLALTHMIFGCYTVSYVSASFEHRVRWNISLLHHQIYTNCVHDLWRYPQIDFQHVLNSKSFCVSNGKKVLIQLLVRKCQRMKKLKNAKMKYKYW